MDPITASIITGLTVALVSGFIFSTIKRKWENKDRREEKTDDEKQKELDKIIQDAEEILEIKKSLWRLTKTVLIIAKILDDQSAKIHPEISTSLEDIATELLRDTDKV